MSKILSTPQVSSVATHTYTFARPFGTVREMAEVVLGAGSGTVSVQFSGSNDGTNFTNIGSAITSTTRNVSLSPAQEVYDFYKIAITISTNTKVVDTKLIFI